MTPGRLQVLATAFGLLMVAAGAAYARPEGRVLTGLAAAALLVGIVVRSAATVAVLVTVVAIAFADPAPALAALAGLSAVAYLLLRYAPDAWTLSITRPTLVGVLGFWLLGWLAASFPFEVARLPVVAPLALVGIYVLVTGPFAARVRGRSAHVPR